MSSSAFRRSHSGLGTSHSRRGTSDVALRTHVARRTPHVALLSVCPICFNAASALTDGVRAGALVLALVAAVVIAGFVRFAWRLR